MANLIVGFLLAPFVVHHLGNTGYGIWALVLQLTGYLGVVDFIPAYGVPLYPIGYLPILGFVILVARAISSYRLVDITPAFAAREIIDTMNDALLVFDRERIIRLANRAACALFGLSKEELAGRPITEVINDPLFSDPERYESLLRAGSTTNFEIAYPNRNSSKFQVPNSRSGNAEPGTLTLSLSASVKWDSDVDVEQPAAVVCMVRDITERKLAEEQLRRQKEYLAALHETSLGLMNRLELADLLEEASCGDAGLLAHFRQPGAHVRGCWVLDAILGKS